MCISNEFPGDADVSGAGPHFENQWFKPSLVSSSELSSHEE